MKSFLYTAIGRLRIAGFLEGVSLIVLVFIGVPLKHLMEIPEVVKILGPIHGALFLLFVFLTIGVSIERGWKGKMIAKLVISCFVPFGTYYIDRTILAKIHRADTSSQNGDETSSENMNA